MNKNEHLKKAQLLKALEKSLGIVSTACKSVGISRTTYYKYYNEDKDFKCSGPLILDTFQATFSNSAIF